MRSVSVIERSGTRRSLQTVSLFTITYYLLLCREAAIERSGTRRSLPKHLRSKYFTHSEGMDFTRRRRISPTQSVDFTVIIKPMLNYDNGPVPISLSIRLLFFFVFGGLYLGGFSSLSLADLLFFSLFDTAKTGSSIESAR